MGTNGRILIINNSELLNNYLSDTFSKYNIEIIISKTTFDGMIKMKNEIPDLIIIDYQLIMTDKIDFFQEKRDYKTVSEIPVICLSSKVDMNAVITAGKNKVSKFFEKPIKQDLLLKAAGEILKIQFDYDETPSIMEVSLNNSIIFIEIGLGINSDKLYSLKYKIRELLNLYNMYRAKILVMFNDVKIQPQDIDKFKLLTDILLDSTGHKQEMIKVLTSDTVITQILTRFENFNKVEIVKDLSDAIDSLGTINIEALVSNAAPPAKGEVQIDNNIVSKDFIKKPLIAIVDDDQFIQDLIEASIAPLNPDIIKYTDGHKFLDTLKNGGQPDLLFLDLMMPAITGFDVLQKLKEGKYTIPVIIFSSLSQKETVTRVMQYGIKRYMVKPIDPETILRKASEVLKSDF